ncbi:MAG: acyl--CoA ligase [Deltaproteobacteria bacterium]|nr:acyl--CoA ligase [Deltaproteobacteria bacterium]
MSDATTSDRTPAPEEAVAEAMRTRSLPDLVADCARRFGDREALVWGDVRWSYAELARQAAGAAEGLRALGVQPGEPVGVLLPNWPEFFTVVAGITSLGAVAVCLNTMATESELAFYLRHAGVERVVYTPRFLKHDYDAMLSRIARGDGAGGGGAVPIRERVAILRDGTTLPDGARDWRDVAPPHPGGAERLAVIAAEQDGLRDARAVMFFTSGSTAQPKAVLHAHRALVHQAFVASAAFGLDASDASWGCLPMFFAGGFVIIALITFARGGKVVLQDHFEAGRALDLMEREGITFYAGWQLAPALCEHESFPRRKLRLRKGIYTNVAAAEKLLAPDNVTVGAYGLSETATLVCAGRWTDPADLRQRGFGRPLPGVEMRVVDPETRQPCAPGDVGELLVHGPSLMLGYLGLPASEAFDADGFFRTGDYGRLDETGTLRFDGRLKEVIKTAGVNVAAAEVEACLESMADVAAAYVVPVPHPVRGENVGAFVVPRAGTAVDAAAVLEHCRHEMASYKIPRHVFALGAADVPRTGTQKVDKPRLRKLAAEKAGSAEDLAAAGSPDGAAR